MERKAGKAGLQKERARTAQNSMEQGLMDKSSEGEVAWLNQLQTFLSSLASLGSTYKVLEECLIVLGSHVHLLAQGWTGHLD